MKILKELIEQSRIQKQSLRSVISSIITSTDIEWIDAENPKLGGKEIILDEVRAFLENILASGAIEKKSKKLEIIQILDKLNFRKEVFEIFKNKTSLEDLKIAGERLGKKSQSAFSK